MPTMLREIAAPELDVPLERPALPRETFAARAEAAYSGAGKDWLVVYADREHFNNIAFLTGFEPRFEEALLLLGRNGQRILVTGNESLSYAAVARLPGLDLRLAQTLSLMGQDRSIAPSLGQVLRDCGLKRGDTIGLVGWKYIEKQEEEGGRTGFFVPHFIVDLLRQLAGGDDAVSDAGRVLMHPTTGLLSVVDADQIAEFEWAAARASTAVRRILTGAREGDSELSMASRMAYAGEPLTAHVMLASAGSDAEVIGLRSPTARIVRRGDGITTAAGYWGGLSARAGLFDGVRDDFLAVAKAYFDGLVAWYDTADVGVAGGDIHRAVTEALARGGLKSALNPGHLTGYTEWTHTPVRPGSAERIASGMPFQVDIIPVPMPMGWTLNCEDPVTFADSALRATLRSRHPAVHQRIEARRSFVRDAIGIDLKPSILPMSNTPLWLPPFWLAADQILVRG